MEVKGPSFDKVISGSDELAKSILGTLSLSCDIEHSLGFNVPSHSYRWKWIIFNRGHWLLLQKDH